MSEQIIFGAMDMSNKEFYHANESRNFRNEAFEKENNYNSYNVQEKTPEESRLPSRLDSFS